MHWNACSIIHNFGRRREFHFRSASHSMSKPSGRRIPPAEPCTAEGYPHSLMPLRVPPLTQIARELYEPGHVSGTDLATAARSWNHVFPYVRSSRSARQVDHCLLRLKDTFWYRRQPRPGHTEIRREPLPIPKKPGLYLLNYDSEAHQRRRLRQPGISTVGEAP